MTDWPVVRLGEYVRIKHGFAFRGEYFSDKGEYVVLTPGNFIETGGFKPKSGSEKYYLAPPPAEFVLNRGDVVIAMTEQAQGLLGSAALIPKSNVYLHNQRIGLIERHNNDVDLRFLYFLFNTSDVRNQIQATATGSKVRHTAPIRVEAVSFSLPPLRTQQSIIAVLTAYDELIENNARRIEILEEMAQAIFREWFVEFRYPGHEDVPLVDSELGPIPEGWELRSAPEALDISPSTRIAKDSLNPFVPMTSVSESHMHMHPVELKVGNSGAKFRNGDTLFARITPCLENGKTAYVQFLDHDQVGCGSTELIVLRGKKVGPEYTYLMARSEGFRANAIASMSGATGRQRVRNECFDTFLLAVPPSSIADSFSQCVRPMFELSNELFKANVVLRETRDLLLPRLISGEIDVSGLDIELASSSL